MVWCILGCCLETEENDCVVQLQLDKTRTFCLLHNDVQINGLREPVFSHFNISVGTAVISLQQISWDTQAAFRIELQAGTFIYQSDHFYDRIYDHTHSSPPSQSKIGTVVDINHMDRGLGDSLDRASTTISVP